MKIKTLIAVSGLALAATAQAGEEASAKQVIAPIAALCDWSWFAGGSVGVIDGDDWDETSTPCTLVKRENVLAINAHKHFIWRWVTRESDLSGLVRCESWIHEDDSIDQRILKSFQLP